MSIGYEIVFLDTETTGIHPEREIWELAMIGRTKDGQESAPVIMQFAVDESKADPFAFQINGYYNRHFAYAELRDSDATICYNQESMIIACQIIGGFTHGAHIIGAVPNFDTESLDKLLRRNKILPTWHYHLIDVENLAVGYLMAKGNSTVPLPWKSDELSKAIGVEPPSKEERHTALGDVKWAMRTYDKIMEGVENEKMD